MLDRKQVEEIVRVLSALPADKVAEARDFLLFLEARYGQARTIDVSDTWTEADRRDLTAAAMHYAGQSIPS